MSIEIIDMERLSTRHKEALSWFVKNKQTDLVWPIAMPNGDLVACKAKGTYKPAWLNYALSIRKALISEHPDDEPSGNPRSEWSLKYFQEGLKIDDRDRYYTNRALMACLKDKVPVGVLIQVSAKPDSRYRVYGLGEVISWRGGYFFIRGI